jgi:hypothetical protein
MASAPPDAMVLPSGVNVGPVPCHNRQLRSSFPQVVIALSWQKAQSPLDPAAQDLWI